MIPRFSIIIPTFNRRDELARCLRSIICTSFTSYEIILVDDGSTDNTKDVLNDFIQYNIFYHRIPNSGAPARPRNVGLSIARGEYVLFVDSDDEFVGDRLLFLDTKIKGCADIYYHDIILSRNISFSKVKYSQYANGNVFKDLIEKGNFIYTSTICIRRNVLLESDCFFDESMGLKTVEDYDLWIRLARCGLKFQYLKGAYIKYNHDDNSISKQSSYAMNVINLLKKWRSELTESEYKIFKTRSYFYAASIFYSCSEYINAYRIFKVLFLKYLLNHDVKEASKSLLRFYQCRLGVILNKTNFN